MILIRWLRWSRLWRINWQTPDWRAESDAAYDYLLKWQSGELVAPNIFSLDHFTGLGNMVALEQLGLCEMFSVGMGMIVFRANEKTRWAAEMLQKPLTKP